MVELHPRISARRAHLARLQWRETILQAAEQLIRLHGSNKLSARSLSSAAGVIPTEIYEQFTGLDELKLAVAARTICSLGERLQAISSATGSAEQLTALSVGYIEFSSSHRNLWLLVVMPGWDSDLPRWYTSALQQLSDPFAAALQSRRAGQALWAGVHHISALAVREGATSELAELALCLTDAFVTGRHARQAASEQDGLRRSQKLLELDNNEGPGQRRITELPIVE